MNQARLRITVFSLWVGFWIITTCIMVISPWIRRDIERADILPAILAISTIWLPPLSCLAAFWFPPEARTKARAVHPGKDKVAAALGITLTYLVFVVGLIIYSTFFVQANIETADPGNITLLGQIGESVKIALLVSPVALAPISWMTGGTNSSHLSSPQQ